MEITKLGHSEIEISRIGFGCMSLENDLRNSVRLLNRAFSSGINFFDTADLYQKGHNEVMVGEAFKSNRNQVVIATKVGNQWRDDGTGWDWNPTREYILKAVDASLKRLQTDYIDLYQLHGGTIDDPIEETIAAFEELLEQGKIRSYGISSIRPNVISEYVKKAKVSTVMMQYSLLDRRPEEHCMGLLEENAIGILARGGLAKGLLVDKQAKAYLGYSPEEVGRVARAIVALSHPGRSPAQVALSFVLADSSINAAVVGIRTASQLDDCLGVFQNEPLTSGELSDLKGVLPVNEYDLHR